MVYSQREVEEKMEEETTSTLYPTTADSDGSLTGDKDNDDNNSQNATIVASK